MSFSASTDASGSSILSEKVSRALEVRTDTPAMKAALEALSHLPSESMDSRSVRVAIERDALQQAMLLQTELQRLLKVVSELRQGVSETAQIVHKVSEAVNVPVVMQPPSGGPASPDLPAMPDSLPLSSEDALEKEQQLAALLSDAFAVRHEANQRVDTVTAFLEKFDLSEADSDLLDAYNFEDMEEEQNEGSNFLDALERVSTILSELSTTFGTSSTHVSELLGDNKQHKMTATSAIRMMEGLAQKQEHAYERLYHWLQKYLHLNSVTHVPTSSSRDAGAIVPEIDADSLDEALSHPFVRRSLKVMYNVPAFYSHTLELIASSRRAEETRRFLLALTAGFGGRSPIELKAHDPVAYVGDMLAFCFQSCSVEADVALGLVVESDHMSDDDAETTELASSQTAADMLSHAMSGLARPLKSRVVQVVASLARRPDEDPDDGEGGTQMDQEEEDVVARSRASSLFSICGLLIFYHSAIGKTVQKIEHGDVMPKENPLMTALVECLSEGSQAYMASIKVYGAMLESLSLISGTPEASLVSKMVQDVTKVRMESPGFAADVECPAEFVSTLKLEFVVETLLQSALALCKTLDDTVTLKMSLTVAKKAGLTTTLASQLDGQISQMEQNLIQDVVVEETKEVLESCGLAPIVTAWRNMPAVEGMVMASQPGLSPDDLEISFKEFYASLYSPPLPSFEEIKDPVLRKVARQRIASNVVEVYEELYDAVRSEKGGYNDMSFLGHTPDQVKTLFSA